MTIITIITTINTTTMTITITITGATAITFTITVTQAMQNQHLNQESSALSTPADAHKINSDKLSSENKTVDDKLKVTATPGVTETEHDANVNRDVVDSIPVPTPWVKKDESDTTMAIDSSLGQTVQDQSTKEKSEVNISAHMLAHSLRDNDNSNHNLHTTLKSAHSHARHHLKRSATTPSPPQTIRYDTITIPHITSQHILASCCLYILAIFPTTKISPP